MTLGICNRTNTCLECDSTECVRAGDIEQDCHAYHCIRADHDCANCKANDNYAGRGAAE